MGLVEQTRRNGVKVFDRSTLNGAAAADVTPEVMERSRRRAEHARLKREVDIIKKATASFAQDAQLRTPGSLRTATASP